MSPPAQLTTVDAVRQYLSHHQPLISSEILPLSGGTANYAYRLKLDTLYEGQSSLILKYSAPHIASNPTFAFDVARQKYEVDALKLVRSWVDKAALVNVPEVYLFDEPSGVVVMEDCGPQSKTLKELMIGGDMTSDIAAKLGQGLGEFLSLVHEKGGPEYAALFKSNEQARMISIWATYGRLVSTLSGADGLPMLLDPPLDVDEGDIETIADAVAAASAALEEADSQFVMGDFWPGNVLVNLDEKEEIRKVLVVDWELAKSGIRATDVGQFCAELHLLRHFHPERREISSLLLDKFSKSYAQRTQQDSKESRAAAIHVGAHLVAWGPRVPWGSKEKTQEVVIEGVNLLVDEKVDLQKLLYM